MAEFTVTAAEMEKKAEDLYKAGEKIVIQAKFTDTVKVTGITDNARDAWDKKVHAAYGNVADELVERLGK